ncbi:carbohydrate-binding protein [Streptomyces palmae]|uniref:Dioxygenase n=1 Tax=Streptomyces palmae TaxID=1701085 RepID=A0A4Z0HBH6_9ACTN|nr:carbohydrate-binding protein [Streptomyces palmae]TGB16542.1 dioxygenase [Streptomyces palmae]
MADEHSPQAPGPRHISRKSLIQAALVAAPASLLLGGGAALARDHAPTADRPLTPTPYCTDGHETPEQIEGPYFKPNSPLRSSLVEPGTAGTRLTVTGFVFGLTCRPVAGALLDFWQADNAGVYDNTGFRFRGHQFTGADGAFRLETIVPGLYPGRTRHIHVKVQAPGEPVLTTQLYFPGEPGNSSDSLFDPRLLMTVSGDGSGRQGAFDFVLDVAGDPTDPPGGSWQPGTAYRVGDQVTYGGAAYVCLQAHTAVVGWEPPSTPALWRRAG